MKTTKDPFKHDYFFSDLIQRHDDAGITYYLSEDCGCIASLTITYEGYKFLKELIKNSLALAKKFNPGVGTLQYAMFPLPGVKMEFNEEDDGRHNSPLTDYVQLRPTNSMVLLEYRLNNIITFLIMHPSGNEVLFELECPDIDTIDCYFNNNYEDGR